jgi:hypothetical protein
MSLFYKKKINANHISVKLKSILGIKPQIYIPVIYSILLVGLLFSIFFLPGILKNGTYMNFNSSPVGASVYVDGIRVGATPVTSFVKKGSRTIEVRKENFLIATQDVKVKGRLFGTLFFKIWDNYQVDLKVMNSKKILTDSYSNLAPWSLISEKKITTRFTIPTYLSSALENYYIANEINNTDVEDFLRSSFKLVTNVYILKDYLRAIEIYSTKNNLNKDPSMVMLDLLKGYNNVELLLQKHIYSDSEKDIDYRDRLVKEHNERINNIIISYGSPKRNLLVSNITFINIPQGVFTPLEANLIHQIKEEDFYVSSSPISRDLYNRFIEDTPKWSRNNLEELINEGLADEYYLLFDKEEEYITNISYFAANEFIEWANNNLEIPEGWELSLPSENMWISAKTYGSVNFEAYSWTNQGFYIYEHFLTDNNGKPIPEFSFNNSRLIVGSNKYNPNETKGRGVQEALWCTPFVSITPVLIRK